VEVILEDVIETLSILAVSAELMYFVHNEVPARLKGDSGKLRQVVMNLVGTLYFYIYKSIRYEFNSIYTIIILYNSY
jgi:hypothetical protein